MKFAQGGYIRPHEQTPGTVRMMSVGQCAKGHTLWSIEGDAPCHFITAEEARNGTDKFGCADEVAGGE